ncbi:MAG: serine--tRNA ligase [Planctomycetes bacterium]|nr:serine--tRNA ligase [Planctomycetota bacterium]
MLDIKYLRANLDGVRDGARRKRFTVDFDRILALDAERRQILSEVEALRGRQNKTGKEMARLDDAGKQRVRAEMAEVSQREKQLSEREKAVKVELNDLLARVPNPPAAEVPEGKDDTENVEVSRSGEASRFDFEPRDHITLGLSLGLLDFERVARISGSRTYILMREGALLELSVLRFAVDRLLQKGFVPMVVPSIVKYDALYGTAYFPGGEEQAYACERDGLFLAGTSEVPVTAFHAGETLEERDLPLLYCGISSCFRREAGAAGKDTKGLYRIHQFQKVEQVVIGRNDEQESKRHHEFILHNSEELLQQLGLPYRVVNVCTGDLGMGQVQKFDVECWMPSRGGWGETHSASRFHDFQARRLNLRYRDGAGKMQYCHTLNNTAIASPRILIALLENYQEADGGVRIPDALVPYMGGLRKIEPRAEPAARRR